MPSKGPFKDRVRIYQNGCHIWTGALSSFGYGNVRVGEKTKKTHRYAWELANGLIPAGMCVLHKCDTPACVNPAHLFLGNRAANIADMHAKGRARKARGSEHAHSKLSEESVRRIREAYLFGARQVDLAALHGCVQTAISGIVRRVGWAHLE